MRLPVVTITVGVVIFSGLCLVAPDQLGSQRRTGVKSNSGVEETDDLIGAWLNMIDRAGGAWIPQPDFTALADGAAVKQDSEMWCGIFFKPQVNPHAAKPAATLAIHHATADTADIIRYDYGSTAMRLRLYETVDFALLRIEEGGVDVLKLSQDKRQAAITTIAGGLLNRPAAANAGASPEATWPFQFPKSIEDGSRFSTDASQEPQAMPSWASRVDGGIRAGHLYIFCFKRRQSGDGRLILLNSHHWFDGQAWAPYQRPKGR
jgi:hypothetical protein